MARRGFDASESEVEMVFAGKFKLYRHKLESGRSGLTWSDSSDREAHTMSYKPDCVWKKAHRYISVFEIEYLSKRKSATEKRKYAIGSFMLGYMAMVEKSMKSLVFMTNNKDLYRAMTTFENLVPLKFKKCIHFLCLAGGDLPSMKPELKELIDKLKI